MCFEARIHDRIYETEYLVGLEGGKNPSTGTFKPPETLAASFSFSEYVAGTASECSPGGCDYHPRETQFLSRPEQNAAVLEAKAAEYCELPIEVLCRREPASLVR